MILKFNEYTKLYEYNTGNRNEIISSEKLFTISYEIELSTNKGYIDFRELIIDFGKSFGDLVQKWNLVMKEERNLVETDTTHDFVDYDQADMSEADYIEGGGDLYKGIEIVPKTYFHGIKEAFDFLDDFYDRYDKQDIFHFSDKTGLHVNIGYTNVTKDKWNLLKGYLLLNEDFAVKGYEGRKTSTFAESYKNDFNSLVKSCLKRKYPDFNSHTLKKNLPNIINILNELLWRIILLKDEKTIGFNINKINTNNYIEFRYPGGNISKHDIMEQTLHYANIVLACCDPKYRIKDFYHKLYSFLSKITDVS